MATATIETEMRELEERYWQAMKDRDVKGAQAATSDPCIVAGASGVASVDSKQFAGMMEGADWRIKSARIGDDLIVRELGEDVRLVAYTVHEDLTVAGEPVKLDAADTSVWVKKGRNWECAMHTESLLGDSYGRDRR